VFTWTTQRSTILICGWEDKESKVKGKHLSEFTVYQVRDKKIVPKPLKIAKANDNYSVYESEKKLIFDEIFFINGSFIPTLSSALNCNNECVFSDIKCVLKKKKIQDPTSTKDLLKYGEGKYKGKEPVDNLVTKVGTLAVYGDAQAKLIFSSKTKERLGLDGAAAEEFSSFQRLFKTLEKAGCK
jgi:hypothetical protein